MVNVIITAIVRTRSVVTRMLLKYRYRVIFLPEILLKGNLGTNLGDDHIGRHIKGTPLEVVLRKCAA